MFTLAQLLLLYYAKQKKLFQGWGLLLYLLVYPVSFCYHSYFFSYKQEKISFHTTRFWFVYLRGLPNFFCLMNRLFLFQILSLIYFLSPI